MSDKRPPVTGKKADTQNAGRTDTSPKNDHDARRPSIAIGTQNDARTTEKFAVGTPNAVRTATRAADKFQPFQTLVYTTIAMIAEQPGMQHDRQIKEWKKWISQGLAATSNYTQVHSILKINTFQDYVNIINKIPFIEQHLEVTWNTKAGNAQYRPLPQSQQHQYHTRFQATRTLILDESSTGTGTMTNAAIPNLTCDAPKLLLNIQAFVAPQPYAATTNDQLDSEPEEAQMTSPLPELAGTEIHTKSPALQLMDDADTVTTDGGSLEIQHESIAKEVANVKSWISRAKQSLLRRAAEAHNTFDVTIKETKQAIEHLDRTIQGKSQQFENRMRQLEASVTNRIKALEMKADEQKVLVEQAANNAKRDLRDQADQSIKEAHHCVNSALGKLQGTQRTMEAQYEQWTVEHTANLHRTTEELQNRYQQQYTQYLTQTVTQEVLNQIQGLIQSEIEQAIQQRLRGSDRCALFETFAHNLLCTPLYGSRENKKVALVIGWYT